MAKGKAKDADPAAVDAWLTTLPDDQRRALEVLRQQIKAAAPELIETIGWGVPQYYLGSTQILGFSAAKKHLTFGPGRGAMDRIREELAAYDTGTDTIRFTPERPLPVELVTTLVKACVEAYRLRPS